MGSSTHSTFGAPLSLPKYLSNARCMLAGCRPLAPARAGLSRPIAPDCCAPSAYSCTCLDVSLPRAQSHLKERVIRGTPSSPASSGELAGAHRCRRLVRVDVAARAGFDLLISRVSTIQFTRDELDRIMPTSSSFSSLYLERCQNARTTSSSCCAPQ